MGIAGFASGISNVLSNLREVLHSAGAESVVADVGDGDAWRDHAVEVGGDGSEGEYRKESIQKHLRIIHVVRFFVGGLLLRHDNVKTLRPGLLLGRSGGVRSIPSQALSAG